MELERCAIESGEKSEWPADSPLTGETRPGVIPSSPLGFRLSLHHKDLGIALQTAAEQDLNLPVCALVQQLEAELIDAGHGDEDVSCLRRWPDRDAAARGDGRDADQGEPQPSKHDIDANE